MPSFERNRIAGKKKVNAIIDGFLILFGIFGFVFKKWFMLKMNKNSKIYVAGHNGLVGSAILRMLKKKAIKIYLLGVNQV